MRKILCIAFCLVLFSAAAANAADAGIVVFDLQKVAADSDALKEAKELLDKKFGPQKTELEKEREAVEKVAGELEKEREAIGKLPENKRQPRVAAFEKKAQDFGKQQRDYTEKAQAFMRLLQADELRVRTELDNVINSAATALAKRKGYVMVLDAGLVPYADPSLDVTNDMLTETNTIWKQLNQSAPERAAAAAKEQQQ